MRKILDYSFNGGVAKRSLYVALLVGTVLNVINQGDTVLRGEALNVTKLLLTYFVPYCVATYGAVSFRLAEERKTRSESSPS